MAEGQEFFRTPGGSEISMFFRDDTNDRDIIHSILDENEYGIHDNYVGWAVDIGAHIGTWSIAMAMDNPYLNVMAVEALAENALMAQRNVRLNNLEDRVKVVQRAASSSNHPQAIAYGFSGHADGVRHRYIGDQRMPQGTDHMIQTVPGIRLTRLLRLIGGKCRILKIDCEGCEWQFLRGKDLKNVEEIVGEYHSGGEARLAEALPGFGVTADGGEFGQFRAVRLQSA